MINLDDFIKKYNGQYVEDGDSLTTLSSYIII